jgi:uncharacterized iron-regulated protein
MQKISIYLLLSLTLLAVISCKKEETTANADVINNISDNIIVATYTDLDTKAGLLLTAINALKTGGATNDELTAAKAAWVAARAPWEASEGFLFGPVADNEIDPNIDTWPLDSIGVDAILSGSTVLNKAYIDALTDDAGTGLKGFHLIEYLLWGSNSNKTATALTARELDYLVAATESLKGKTDELKTAWMSSGGNFVNQLKSRGSRYPSEKSVLVELAEGIRSIAGEVFDSKIQNTLDGLDADGLNGGLREEESRFSANTKIDFTNNITSIQNVYLGQYGSNGNGKGLSNIVASKNATLDAKIKTQIAEAIVAIQAIGGAASTTYSVALGTNRASIETAQAKVETLEKTLRTELLPLVSGL